MQTGEKGNASSLFSWKDAGNEFVGLAICIKKQGWFKFKPPGEKYQNALTTDLL
jgi:hypothetical protein